MKGRSRETIRGSSHWSGGGSGEVGTLCGGGHDLYSYRKKKKNLGDHEVGSMGSVPETTFMDPTVCGVPKAT